MNQDDQDALKQLWWSGGGAQWAKIMVHSTWIKWIYENGQIFEQIND